MDKKCTVYRTANFIGKRWTLPILMELHKGSSKWKRYSHLKNSLPEITAKILSTRLKELKKEGLITKKVDAENFPIKSEYSLTRSGEDFIPILKDIKAWALKRKFKNITCEKTDCSKCDL
jgi:DNA-binding HxlR family transcriptional regulator